MCLNMQEEHDSQVSRLYVYAIAERSEAALPENPGIAQGALSSITYNDLAAIVSLLPTASVEITEETVWLHEETLEMLMQRRAILPVRFGTAMDNAEAVRSMLAAHYDDFTANLDQVRGRVELGLRVLWDENQQEQCETHPQQMRGLAGERGREYMLTQLEKRRQFEKRRQHAEKLIKSIHNPLAELAVAYQHRMLITPRLLLTAAYLVARDQVEQFRVEIEKLAVLHGSLRFLCTGPWPAYNFVTAPAAAMQRTQDRNQDRNQDT